MIGVRRRLFWKVYSNDELRRLLAATTSLHVAHSRLRAPMYRALLLLLYGSGLPGLNDHRVRCLRIGRDDWGMSAYSPVIELPLIREPRVPQTACSPFARSALGLIFVPRRTSGASCPRRLRCPADMLSADSGHGHITVSSGC